MPKLWKLWSLFNHRPNHSWWHTILVFILHRPVIKKIELALCRLAQCRLVQSHYCLRSRRGACRRLNATAEKLRRWWTSNNLATDAAAFISDHCSHYGRTVRVVVPLRRQCTPQHYTQGALCCKIWIKWWWERKKECRHRLLHTWA